MLFKPSLPRRAICACDALIPPFMSKIYVCLEMLAPP